MKYACFDIESINNFQTNCCQRLTPLGRGRTTNRDGEIITEIQRESIIYYIVSDIISSRTGQGGNFN